MLETFQTTPPLDQASNPRQELENLLETRNPSCELFPDGLSKEGKRSLTKEGQVATRQYELAAAKDHGILFAIEQVKSARRKLAILQFDKLTVEPNDPSYQDAFRRKEQLEAQIQAQLPKLSQVSDSTWKRLKDYGEETWSIKL
jgi:hypothetical protein